MIAIASTNHTILTYQRHIAVQDIYYTQDLPHDVSSLLVAMELHV
jgi:hypothetical protein